MANSPLDNSRNQSALRNVTAGHDIVIDQINQTNNYQNLSTEQATDRQLRLDLLGRLDLDWFERHVDSECKLDLILESRYELCAKHDKRNVSMNIQSIYDQWVRGKRILLLGPPGSGKTETLKQLAYRFRQQISEKNICDRRIPIFAFFSSWIPGQSFKECLIQQLTSPIYGARKDLAEKWVEDRNIFPFMDGLDQVSIEQQKQYLQEIDNYGSCDMVLCCRSEQYKELYSNMNLGAHIDMAVEVQPLSTDQINNYLTTVGKELIIEMLQDKDNDQLRTLASVPFWLKIIASVKISQKSQCSFEDLQQILFGEYVDQMFSDSKDFSESHQLGKLYAKNQTLKRLAWLASYMKSNRKSVFLIEEMQPGYLTNFQKKLYFWTTMINGLLLGLVFGIPYAWILSQYLSVCVGSSPYNTLLLGITAGAILGTSAQFFLKVHKLSIKTHKDVRLSWEKAKNALLGSFRRSLLEAAGISLLVSLFCYFAFSTMGENIRLALSLILGGYFGALTLMLRLLSNITVEKTTVKTVRPNQGIIDSRKRALYVAKYTSIFMATITTVILLIIPYNNKSILELVILGWFTSVVSGVAASFIHDSGRACQQHFALRLVLTLTGDIPWNFSRFLDYCSQPTKLAFLNKLGGGYQFFNELLKEYWASSTYSEEIKQPEESAVPIKSAA